MHKSSPEKFAATNNDNNPYLSLPSQTKNHSRLDKVADMFSALSKTEALVIFLAAKNGLS